MWQASTSNRPYEGENSNLSVQFKWKLNGVIHEDFLLGLVWLFFFHLCIVGMSYTKRENAFLLVHGKDSWTAEGGGSLRRHLS